MREALDFLLLIDIPEPDRPVDAARQKVLAILANAHRGIVAVACLRGEDGLPRLKIPELQFRARLTADGDAESSPRVNRHCADRACVALEIVRLTGALKSGLLQGERCFFRPDGLRFFAFPCQVKCAGGAAFDDRCRGVSMNGFLIRKQGFAIVSGAGLGICPGHPRGKVNLFIKADVLQQFLGLDGIPGLQERHSVEGRYPPV